MTSVGRAHSNEGTNERKDDSHLVQRKKGSLHSLIDEICGSAVVVVSVIPVINPPLFIVRCD